MKRIRYVLLSLAVALLAAGLFAPQAFAEELKAKLADLLKGHDAIHII